jgi:hypothetical protein
VGKYNRCDNKHEPYKQPGYSILLFDKQNGKNVHEGDMIKRFLYYKEHLEKENLTHNLGWELIKLFPESLK